MGFRMERSSHRRPGVSIELGAMSLHDYATATAYTKEMQQEVAEFRCGNNRAENSNTNNKATADPKTKPKKRWWPKKDKKEGNWRT